MLDYQFNEIDNEGTPHIKASITPAVSPEYTLHGFLHEIRYVLSNYSK